LIPQMVGAGVLVTPLFGLPHWAGVVMVGAVVILIVTTAGMVSTTYVQFLKGGLLVIFSTVLVVLILNRGLSVDTQPATSQTVTVRNRETTSDGKPHGTAPGQADLRPVGSIARLPDGQTRTGALGPVEFLRTIQQSDVVLWRSETRDEPDGATSTIYRPVTTSGHEVMRPGNHPSFAGLRSDDPL